MVGSAIASDTKGPLFRTLALCFRKQQLDQQWHKQCPTVVYLFVRGPSRTLASLSLLENSQIIDLRNNFFSIYRYQNKANIFLRVKLNLICCILRRATIFKKIFITRANKTYAAIGGLPTYLPTYLVGLVHVCAQLSSKAVNEK